MAVSPLSAATHHRLGGPLPHQLSNAPQAPPKVTHLRLSKSCHATRFVIRYYQPFPAVIPIFRTDCLRVTHPFATRSRSFPFDLHVLGMPPALILSQDQTLIIIFFYFTSFTKYYLRNPASTCYFCLFLFSFQRPSRLIAQVKLYYILLALSSVFLIIFSSLSIA